jgi:ubiquinone/menaquinone biosynthesis C-methylase UbiE
VPKTGKCLELGCGTGDILICLNQKGYDCTGIDISSTALESARVKTALLSTTGFCTDLSEKIGTEESLLSEFSAAGLVTLTHGIKHLGEESPDAEELYFLLQKQTG